jgi:hypothetical protein
MTGVFTGVYTGVLRTSTNPGRFPRFLLHYRVRARFVKGAKVADFLGKLCQAFPWGEVRRTALLTGLSTRFAPDFSPCLCFFSLSFSASCSACSITSLTHGHARQQFPPSPSLLPGMIIVVLPHLFESGVRFGTMSFFYEALARSACLPASGLATPKRTLFTRCPCGTLHTLVETARR